MTTYLNPDGTEWVPAFPGQRPPFQPGNNISVGNKSKLAHGMYSIRHVDPLAKQIARDLRKLPELDYLNTPRFADLLMKYATYQAQAKLLAAFMDDKSLNELADSTGGKLSLLEQQRLLTARVGNLAVRLGLMPVIPEDVQASIAASRKTLARRAERAQFHSDLIDAAREQRYGKDDR